MPLFMPLVPAIPAPPVQQLRQGLSVWRRSNRRAIQFNKATTVVYLPVDHTLITRKQSAQAGGSAVKERNARARP